MQSMLTIVISAMAAAIQRCSGTKQVWCC